MIPCESKGGGGKGVALLALAGSAGARAAIHNLGEKNGPAPKKRRKMSAAWEVMIAITEKARRGKGERIALQGRREGGPIRAHELLTSSPAAEHPARI
jgi:hypothetical protein